MPLVGDFECLTLCLYGIRELAKQHYDLNQSEHSVSTNESAPLLAFYQPLNIIADKISVDLGAVSKVNIKAICL